ncbi:hypothetical protein BH18ACT4_BH18ACT4_05110 [soil metagenome]
MKRLFAVLACLVLIASACGDDEVRPAAVVNGDEIAQQDVVDDLRALEANDDYVEGVEGSGGAVRGSSAGTFDAAFAAAVLNQRIQELLVHQELVDRELRIDDECRQAARLDLVRGIGNGDPEVGETLLGGFPRAFRDRLVVSQAEVLRLQGDLAGFDCVTAEAVSDYFEDRPEEFRQACVAVITTETEEDAADAAARLTAGTDFATVATESSIDGGAANGGQLGCVFPSDFEGSAPELGDAVFAATPGQLVGPLQSQVGFHLALVSEFRQATLDEARPEIEQRVGQLLEQEFQEWSAAATAEAEVEVDPRYGRWDRATGQIIAPEAPPSDGDGTDPTGEGSTIPTSSG